MSQHWSATLESSVGLRSINERINQIEPLLEQARQAAITDVPAVVQFDGIWLREQTQTETIKPDKRGRQRHQRSGRKVVLLAALGLWTDGSGRREILDWEIASSEDHTQWELLLNRLWRREVTAEQGLKMIVRDGCGGLGEAVALVYGNSILDQRCIFHKLKNVGESVRSELKGKDHKATRKTLLEQAALIYRAPHAEATRHLLGEWAQHWRSQAPDAVATLERDVEHTLVFYQLETVAREWLRTTSLLERTNRELRRKFRQAITFGSVIGAQAAVYLQVQRLHACWTKANWWDVSHALYFSLADLYP